MKMEDKSEFSKSRRELKEIVRTKVRNVQQKKKPFKRKLGGNKRRKNIKMKKALKKWLVIYYIAYFIFSEEFVVFWVKHF